MPPGGAVPSRRELLRGAAFAAGLTFAWGPAARAAGPAAPGPPADEVLRRLREGNERFVKGATMSPRRTPEDFRPLAGGQRPMAVIVGCSDSRVPPEILFDQGVGDLFVVRVAGNVIGGGGAAGSSTIAASTSGGGGSPVLVPRHT